MAYMFNEDKTKAEIKNLAVNVTRNVSTSVSYYYLYTNLDVANVTVLGVTGIIIDRQGVVLRGFEVKENPDNTNKLALFIYIDNISNATVNSVKFTGNITYVES